MSAVRYFASKRSPNWIALLALVTLGLFWHVSGRTGESATSLPPPEIDSPKSTSAEPQVAVLAGGCFWGVQGVFQHTKGVKQVLAGYSGGEKANARYEQVGTGRTGHAESVQIVFDPREISYGEILRIYFSVAHDPTQLNRQGPDVGTQYRSAIFPQTPEQKETAERVKARLDASGKWKRPITTSIEPASTWYSAEGYHQDYLRKNPGGYSCHFMRD